MYSTEGVINLKELMILKKIEDMSMQFLRLTDQRVKEDISILEGAKSLSTDLRTHHQLQVYLQMNIYNHKIHQEMRNQRLWYMKEKKNQRCRLATIISLYLRKQSLRRITRYLYQEL